MRAVCRPELPFAGKTIPLLFSSRPDDLWDRDITMDYSPAMTGTPGMPDKKRDELRGKVLSLKDLVQYQDGTVASRMIINRKAGSITLFSFDENEGLSEHTAPYDATVTILEGECEVWVQGTTSKMKAGETIIFPANVPHALSAITKFKMILVMIRE